MTLFRIPMLALAIVHASFVGLTAMVGAFADGGDLWSMLLLVVLHPLRAGGLLLLVLTPRLPTARVIGVAALLLATVAVDLFAATLITRGAVKGDWWLPVMFAVIPAMGVVYAFPLALMRQPSKAD